MSLRIFHLFFIAVSALFALGFAAWLTRVALTGGGPVWFLAVLGSVVCAAAMVIYGVRFYRKPRNMVPHGSL